MEKRLTIHNSDTVKNLGNQHFLRMQKNFQNKMLDNEVFENAPHKLVTMGDKMRNDVFDL